MKIESSNVSMSSTHTSYTYEHVESETLTVTSDRAATIELSDDAKSKLDQMKDIKKQALESQKEAAKEQKARQKENEKALAQDMLDKAKGKGNTETQAVSAKSPQDIKLETMKRILELLNRITKDGGFSFGTMKELKAATKALNSGIGVGKAPVASATAETKAPAIEDILGRNAEPVLEIGSNMVIGGRSLTWTKMTVQSSFYMETENTAYVSKGTVKTADGREIDFNVTCEMSRSFEATYESFTAENMTVAFCDPLVINYDGDLADLSDQKFLFDIDADGKGEEISELSSGSGYLALDKNGDGEINDGSELFGAKTGDGFSELAAYDDDHNGWIDENDKIFNKLKVWTKDKNGNSVLMSLKKADVGAIYLGNEDTEFSLNGANNKTNGKVRKTGIFLKESGGAGTVQHIDLAV